MAKKSIPLKSLGDFVDIRDEPAGTATVGTLRESVGEEFVIRGPDSNGDEVEWVIKPTGSNSFELTVPESHELGSPAAWEGVSIMTQRVVSAADNCGCDGNQCGCQGQNCGSNCNSAAGRIRLANEAMGSIFNPRTLDMLRQKF